MKKIILIFSALALFCACNKDLERKLDADVKVSTLKVQAGTPVRFDFSGDPDFIVFYSGEQGHRYDRKDMTELPADQLSAKLCCTFFTQYGKTAENTFHVYVTTEFPGLSKDYDVDKTLINTTKWTDITESCNLPKTANDETYGEKGASSVEIPLEQYLNAPYLNFAFLYKIEDDNVRPRWEVRNLVVRSEDKSSGTVSELPAAEIGFSAFHETENGNDVYNTVTNNTPGRWNLRQINDPTNYCRLAIHPSPVGQDTPLHRSWLISGPVNPRRYVPDTGLSVKTITSYVPYYEYVYSEPGTYTATFVITNANYSHSEEIVKTFTIEVE